jgi:hypothetical protein
MARTRRGAEAVGRRPVFLSQARHMIALGDGVSVPAVGAGEGAQVLRATFWGPATQTVEIGVQSLQDWPCGQDSHLTPGLPPDGALRHEARSVGYWFWLQRRCLTS